MDPSAFDLSSMNWLGLALAVLANMVIGFLWYARFTPTGKIWMRDLGVPADAQPTGAQMARGLILMVIGAFFMMFVFAHTNAVYQDAFRNTATGGTAGYKLTWLDGLMGGFFTWLGFFVPVQLSGVAWEGRPWSLYFVNVGYYLVTLLVAGVLITTVGV
ncbi:MAG TPA: DUF1761 domain-containing protein [Candidatus Thermoplasmatota archaeon]|nr:DUF1761 domain-containing protein [Candidatus Thermoplasmatota archaeon]